MSPTKIAIMVAVEQEFSAVSKMLTAPSFQTVGGFPAVTGRIGAHDVLLAKSGMGADRARQLANVVCLKFKPAALVIAGFAAGLNPALKPGDVVVPGTVRRVGADGFQRIVQYRVLHPNEALYRSASNPSEMPSSISGSCLITYHSIVRYAFQKAAIREEEDSPDVLDMESGVIAAIAEDLGVPWVVIRSITDGAHDDLPLDFTRFSNSSGEVNVALLAFSLMLTPWRIPGLVRLGKRSALAARNLAIFVERYIASLPPE